MQSEQLVAWNAMNMLPRLGPVSLNRALERYDDPEEIAFRLPREALLPGPDDGSFERARRGLDPAALYERALADFDKAVSLNPNLWAAQRNRGFLCITMKRWKEAVESLSAARSMRPDDRRLQERLDWATRKKVVSALPPARWLYEADDALSEGHYRPARRTYAAALAEIERERGDSCPLNLSF